jgi:hypothetical protein
MTLSDGYCEKGSSLLYFFSALLLMLVPVMTASGSDAIVNRYSTEITAGRHKLIVKTSLEIRIENREGERLAMFSFDFSKRKKITRLKGDITDKNGEVVKELSKKQITDQSLFSENTFYSDEFTRNFELRYNDYPYVIHLEVVTEQEEFFSITHWSPVWDDQVRTLKANLDLDIPEDYKINVYTKLIRDLVPVRDDKRLKYHWEASYDSIIEPEIFAPPSGYGIPQVIIRPIEFTYGVEGSMDSWKSFGNYILDLAKGGDELPSTETEIVLKLVSNCRDDREKARVLYHYMQDRTRYVSVNINVGGLQPYPAEYVARNKFGDCKALVNYMQSLLKAAGIRSVYCLVEAGENPAKVIKEIPSSQFNHVILMVPFQNDTAWLECTSSILPFGYLGYFTQGREVLAVMRDRSCLIKTPGQAATDVTNEANWKLSFEKWGSGRGELSLLYRGEDFVDFTSMKAGSSREQIGKYLLKEIPLKSFTLGAWTLERQNRDDASIRLNASLLINGQPRSIGDSYVYDLPAADLPPFEKPAERKFPLHFPLPEAGRDTIAYLIPEGYSLTSSADKIIETKFGSYKISGTLQDKSFVVVRYWQIHADDVSLDEYPAFYSFINSVKDSERKYKLIFKSGN